MSELSVTNLKNKHLFGFHSALIAFLYAILLLGSTPVLASELLDLLEKMSTASQSRNYQGIFVLRKSDQLSTLKVSHGKDERGVWESLETLTGESRKVIRQNNRVISVFPDKKLLTIRRSNGNASLHQKLPENIRQLKKYYSINRLNDDRIAGYTTLVLDLIPKDTYRYGYRYWLENDSGMLLRCDLLDSQHDAVEQMMFTSLQYLDKVPDPAFTDLDTSAYTIQNLENEAKPVSSGKWRVFRAPPGFELTQSQYRGLTSEQELLQLVYSDGLASVSVFIEPMDDKHTQHLKGASKMGAVNAYGRQLDNYYVTVVGEVPAITVMQIAKSTTLTADTDH